MALFSKLRNWFSPGRSSVGRKILGITLMLLLPVALLAGLWLSVSREQSTFASKEIAGLDYLRPLRRLTQHLTEARTLADSARRGDSAAKPKWDASIAEVADDVQAVDLADRKSGTLLGATDSWKTLKADLADPEKGASGRESQGSFARYTRLISGVDALATFVNDSSNLILDPEAESYYMQDALLQLQGAATVMGQAHIEGELGAGKSATTEERTKSLRDVGRVQAGVSAAGRDVKQILKLRPDLEASLKTREREFARASANQVALLEAGLLNPAAAADPNDYRAASNAAIAAGFSLYDAIDPLLGASLQGRIDGVWKRVSLGAAMLGAVLVSVLLAVGYISRNIRRQSAEIMDVVSEIGMGNFDARAKVLSNDELGLISESLNALLDSTLGLMQSQEEKEDIQKAIQKLMTEVTRVASGDLTVDAEVDNSFTSSIADAINFMVSQLREIVGNVQAASMHVSSSTGEILATTEHLLRGSDAQASQILDTSAAIDEIAVSIQQVAQNTSQSLAVAEQARVNARNGSDSVRDTIQGMDRIREQVQETAKRIKRLGESSQEIGEIVQLIGDIAERTSILALNASIQAAMAGEAGMGFAVVAEEVERLADRSNTATKQIATLVKTIQSETAEAVSAMEESTREVVSGSKVAVQAGQALTEIDLVSNRLAEIIKSISMSVEQQARGSEAIARSMTDISEVTQQTAAGTKQAAVSVANLTRLADDLNASMGKFKLPGHLTNGHGGNGRSNGKGGGNGTANGVASRGANGTATRRIPVLR